VLKHPRRVKVERDKDLSEAVDGVIADGAPRLLVRDGETVAVLLSPEAYATLGEGADTDIWAGYDPERALVALRQAKGALRGVDREQLLKDIHDARSQDSHGRPA
jgi:hypothetical protein